MEMGCFLASTLGSPGQLPTLILSSRRGTTFGAPVTRLHWAADCDTGELSNPSCDPGIFQNIFRDLEKLAPQENKTRAGGWRWRWASPKAVAVSDAGRGGFNKEIAVGEHAEEGKTHRRVRRGKRQGQWEGPSGSAQGLGSLILNFALFSRYHFLLYSWYFLEKGLRGECASPSSRSLSCRKSAKEGEALRIPCIFFSFLNYESMITHLQETWDIQNSYIQFHYKNYF